MWNFAKVHWQLYSLLVMLTSRGKLCITWRKWSTDIADSCSNREREHECLPWTDWQELLPHLQSSPILVPHNSETTRNEIFSFFNLCFLCLKSDVKIPLQQNFVKPNLCRHHDQKFRKLYCSVSIFIKLDKNRYLISDISATELNLTLLTRSSSWSSVGFSPNFFMTAPSSIIQNQLEKLRVLELRKLFDLSVQYSMVHAC